MDRPEMVGGSGRISSKLPGWIAGRRRWTRSIRRVLSDDIGRRVPAPAPGQQYPVSVDIHEFYGDSSCNVTLRAAWTIKQPHAAAVQPANEEIQVPASGACPETLAASMSVAVGSVERPDHCWGGTAAVRDPCPIGDIWHVRRSRLGFWEIRWRHTTWNTNPWVAQACRFRF